MSCYVSVWVYSMMYFRSSLYNGIIFVSVYIMLLYFRKFIWEFFCFISYLLYFIVCLFHVIPRHPISLHFIVFTSFQFISLVQNVCRDDASLLKFSDFVGGSKTEESRLFLPLSWTVGVNTRTWCTSRTLKLSDQERKTFKVLPLWRRSPLSQPVETHKHHHFLSTFFVVFSAPYDFEKVKIDKSSSLSVCLCQCVCLSIASHVSETSEAIAFKFDKVTASTMGMHHVSILVTFTLNRGNTSLSCKILVSECFPSALSVSRRVKDACHSNITSKTCSHYTAVGGTGWISIKALMPFAWSWVYRSTTSR